MQEQASIEPPEAAQQAEGRRKTGAHLLRHQVTPEVAAAAAAEFGDDQLKAGEAILKLRQPELRNVFERVYSVTTGSGNNDWMRSKLLQAVGLSTRWRPEQPPADKGEGSAEAAGGAAAEQGRAKRARRVPAALQGTIYGEHAEEGSPERPASSAPAPKRSRGAPAGSGAARPGRQDSAAGGSAGGGATASDAAAAANGGAGTSVTQGPPMVVVVVSDPQVPAWPAFMPLGPGGAAPGGAPFVQTEGGRWQLLPDQLASQLAAQEQARAQQGQAAAAQRAGEQQQLAEQQERQQRELAERHVREQQQLAAQQAREQQALAERHVREQQTLAGQQAQQAAQAQGQQHPQLTAQQLQQVQQAAQLAALRPLSVEDVMVPREQPGGVDAQQAMWNVLQSAGLLPGWTQGGPPAQPAPPPPAAAPAPPTGVWLARGAGAGPPPHSVAAHAPASQFPGPAPSPAGSAGGPKPSPFAAEATVPLPTAREPSASELELAAKHPLASLLQGDLSLMGLAALAEDGGFGLSSMLPTPSADLHKLFGAWQEGRVSLSLSRRDMPGLVSSAFVAPPPREPPPKPAPPAQGQPAAQQRQP